jgi:hypothetical protein
MRQKVITLSVIIFLSSMLILAVVIISVPRERLHTKTILSSSSSTPHNSKASDAEGSKKIHGVKIVSPIRGQKVHAYKNLTVLGTSIANSTSNCLVSITLNGIMPYKRVVPAGPNGTNDYSLWSFIISPKYAPIKVGFNQLKAKFSCVEDPALVSYYSTNISGIPISTTITTPIASIPATKMTNNTSKQLQ